MCQNYQSRDRIGNADIALKCARASGIDWETSGVGQCAGLDGSGTAEEGVALLKESVVATKALGVTYVLFCLCSSSTLRVTDSRPFIRYGCVEKAARCSSMANKSVFTMGHGRSARYVAQSSLSQTQ